MDIRSLADLSQLNTLSLPCTAQTFVQLKTVTELEVLLDSENFNRQELLIIGGGSNLILPPLLNRCVIQYLGQAIEYTEQESGEVVLDVQSGRAWDSLVAETVAQGLVGLENLSLIPGSVGAAPVQNIGAYGVELSDVLESVRAYDIENRQLKTLSLRDCELAYRDSIFKREPGRYFILSIRLRLSKVAPFQLDYGELRALKTVPALSVSEVREQVIAVRKAKLPDPEHLSNAGSFFKNPLVTGSEFESLVHRYPEIAHYPMPDGRVKLAAGWMIDHAGWKGHVDGCVGVHKQQALVLVNYGGATQADILALAAKIQNSIRERFGITLEIEPVVIPAAD